ARDARQGPGRAGGRRRRGRMMEAGKSRIRCAWAGSDPLMIDYHDGEWGVPLHDDRRLFEMLVLEGAQAGLSWTTILRKRPALRGRGFRFVGPTICYAFMQATGMVNDHLVGCFRYREVSRIARGAPAIARLQVEEAGGPGPEAL